MMLWQIYWELKQSCHGLVAHTSPLARTFHISCPNINAHLEKGDSWQSIQNLIDQNKLPFQQVLVSLNCASLARHQLY